MRVTSISKVAEYRAALRTRIEEAKVNEIACRVEGDIEMKDAWWGVADGLQDALRLTKMLD